MIFTCPCGFVAAASVSPTSPAWHRLHRDHHLTAYPNVDQRTRESLDELIASAERSELVAGVDEMAIARRRKAARS